MRLAVKHSTLFLVWICSAFVVSTAFPVWSVNTTTFFPFTFKLVSPVTRSSAIDMGYLNNVPAGAHGAVAVRQGHFVEALSGTRLRFWGVNLRTAANFPEHSQAEKLAAVLAARGFNIVRLHQLDNSWNRAGSIWGASLHTHQVIEPEKLDRLDYLVAQLKARGIYVNINLCCNRHFTEADGFSRTMDSKGVALFDSKMIDLQKSYAKDLLSHVNRYTKLSYAQDPCVAVIEIANENSLVDEGSKPAWLAKLPEPLRQELKALWGNWLKGKRPQDLPASFDLGNPQLPSNSKDFESNSWKSFLCDLEIAYTRGMRDYLKEQLKVKACITGTQASFGGTCAARRDLNMDFVDDHLYWQHPSFAGKSFDKLNFSVQQRSLAEKLLTGKVKRTLATVDWKRLPGKPFTLSEYNHPAPLDCQCETVPMLAAFSAARDWDAAYLFDYGQLGSGADDEDSVQGWFDIASNPAKIAFLPFAALAYRKGQIPVTKNSDAAVLGGFSKFVDPATDATCLTLSCPLVQAVVGMPGRANIKLGECAYQFEGDKRGAALTLNSLDSVNIGKSKHLLLSVCGAVENTGQVWTGSRTSLLSWGRAPVLASIPAVEVVIANPNVHHIYALAPNGSRQSELTIKHDLSGALRFRVSSTDKTIWYELVE